MPPILAFIVETFIQHLHDLNEVGPTRLKPSVRDDTQR